MRALKEFRICRGFFVFIFIFSIQCCYENALFVVGLMVSLRNDFYLFWCYCLYQLFSFPCFREQH